jgi:hypothetical protein
VSRQARTRSGTRAAAGGAHPTAPLAADGGGRSRVRIGWPTGGQRDKGKDFSEAALDEWPELLDDHAARFLREERPDTAEYSRSPGDGVDELGFQIERVLAHVPARRRPKVFHPPTRRLLSRRHPLPSPAKRSRSSICAPSPTALAPTARRNGSSAPCSAAGPTAPSTAAATNAARHYPAGSSSTIDDDHTAPSATNRRYSGWRRSGGTTWLGLTPRYLKTRGSELEQAAGTLVDCLGK